MLKFYLYLMVFCLIFIWFGFIGPYCISSKSTELIAGWIIIGLIFYPIIIKKGITIMKNIINNKNLFNLIIIMVFIPMLMNCSKVPAGNVGIKFYLLGKSKGVDYEELTPGRYWIGFNEELFLFPTFTQTETWTKDINEGSPVNQQIEFQTKEGMSVSADIGITYRIDPNKVSSVFEKYKKGIDEITDKFLRNMVRDAFVEVASTLPVESVYGEGKSSLMNDINERVSEQVKNIGIIIEKIYLVGSMRLPEAVTTALNLKIQATQRAQQRENELREAEAQAKKQIAEAEGTAQSKLKIAEADAKANILVSKSLTPELVKYKAIQKWDGVLPKVSGQANSFIDLRK